MWAGERGVVFVDLLDQSLHWREASRGPQLEQKKVHARDHLKLEQEDFFKSILSQKSPTVGMEEGLSTVRLMEEILRPLSREHFWEGTLPSTSKI